VFTLAALPAGAALLSGLAVAFPLASHAMLTFAVLAAEAPFSVHARMAFALSLAGHAMLTLTAFPTGAALLSGLAVAFPLASHAMLAFAVLAACALHCSIDKTHGRHN